MDYKEFINKLNDVQAIIDDDVIIDIDISVVQRRKPRIQFGRRYLSDVEKTFNTVATLTDRYDGYCEFTLVTDDAVFFCLQSIEGREAK